MATASGELKLANAPPTANTLTIRLLMAGKEVGSIIGKKGEIIKKFRDESGSRINISDGSCPERIVTITGTKDTIYKAFTLICNKFEEDLQTLGTNVPKPPITLRLIVPASQCGSLIGKGGSKIKELREFSGASVQVASEMLPNSNERAVTVSGVGEAIPQCIYQICKILLETPPKGATIPYRPKPQIGGPMIVAGGQAYTIQGNYAVPATPDVSNSFNPTPTPPPPISYPTPPQQQLLHVPGLRVSQYSGSIPVAMATFGGYFPAYAQGPPQMQDLTKLTGSPLASLAALGLGGIGGATGLNPAASVAALAALAGTQLRGVNGNNSQTSHEMTVPNELIGCIIGKGGTKIAEIRQVSGAMIRISNCEDREGVTPTTERTVTITGSPESVALAQYLINTRLALETAAMGMAGYPFLAPTAVMKTQ
ncbi:poly(rC)-binding protein 2-like isoform X3 [Artemia franciscana]|uniref:K Homology domain-containing protein n=1 Tax=Artemia franciscana TaxID=6661 RepID=A0AA88HAK7_ARTSF|nr:hypothetical protein QYM36_018074 [Artemia franciscana]KAK2703494.1 hypothetical protein QYM36_018074 [Artemia franciscana]